LYRGASEVGLLFIFIGPLSNESILREDNNGKKRNNNTSVSVHGFALNGY